MTEQLATHEPEVEEEEVACAITVVPMVEWVENNPATDEECKPCMLGPVAQWYSETLRENDRPDLADELEAYLGEDSQTEVLEFAKKLDDVKAQVTEETRTRLLDFDCSAQAFTPEGEEEDGDGKAL